MFCKQCGSEIPENALFCTNCGARQIEAPAADELPEMPETEEPEAEMPEAQEPVQEACGYEAPVQEAGEASGAYNFNQPPYGQSQFVPPENAAVPVPDYLVVNIILTAVSLLSCCGCCSMISLIAGIIGIVFSAQTRKAKDKGDFKTAQEKSKVAKIMWIISVILLSLSLLLSIILVATGAYASLANQLTGYNWIGN